MIDYALHHEAVSDLVRSPDTREGWEALALGPERVADFERDGFLSGIRVFDEAQVERLRGDLARLAGPASPGRDLFYEYHANESQDPETCLFHALGAWRTSPLFHDVLWAPVLRIVCHQLLGGKPIRFLHDQLFCKP
ncbi:MAG: phytanoyl-CoA dioxygenase family protein, partial [Verrucomicrobiota bacterium]